ncbi:MAG: disulfide bond formation protein B [Alphaproteobacteria bacterium]
MHRIYWGYIPIIATIIAISSALILQYFFHYAPCELCYKQRYLWYATGAFGILTLFWREDFLIFPALALIFASAALGIYQSGMVFEWWQGVSQCGLSSGISTSIDNLGQLDLNNLSFQPSCSSIDQKLLGYLPLPFANTLFSCLTFTATYTIYRSRR